MLSALVDIPPTHRARAEWSVEGAVIQLVMGIHKTPESGRGSLLGVG